jgi:hypothetical protein
LSQKRQFFAEIFGENIFKIITSVPGHSAPAFLRAAQKGKINFLKLKLNFSFSFIANPFIKIWGRCNDQFSVIFPNILAKKLAVS